MKNRIMEKYLKFNLNSHILIKLSLAGFEHWKKHYDEFLPNDVKEPIEYYKQRENADGYVEFQMHEFISVFGETIKAWEKPIFETNVLFRASELTPV